ncbi:MAG: hypothetical protein E7056_00635 [Lentisphaerae bacterium]|nr:hypothetical protein [Lentisphaerota bacterium]
MKITRAFSKIAAAFAVGLVAISSAQAGFWDWTRPFQGPGRSVTTLVITGNYKRPLALAQLMRAENRQPYLLIPAQESGLKDVYFCPVSERTPAVRLRAEDITRFVRLLNPGKVIILGDVRYVPENYVPQLDGRIPIFRLDGDDWNRNAESLGSMLNLNHLERDYKRIGAKLDKDELYRPLPTPEKPKAAAAEKTEVKSNEEPKAPTVTEVPPAVKDPDPAAGKVAPVGEIKTDSDEK